MKNKWEQEYEEQAMKHISKVESLLNQFQREKSKHFLGQKREDQIIRKLNENLQYNNLWSKKGEILRIQEQYKDFLQ